VYSGNEQIISYGASNSVPDSLTYPFEQGEYYSLFVVGTSNSYKNIVVQDNYDSLNASSGKAYIRYVNAIAGTLCFSSMFANSVKKQKGRYTRPF
jgi:hypothetical protein